MAIKEEEVGATSLIDSLRRSAVSESHALEDGTLLIGKLTPPRSGLFQDAYLHEVYAPLGACELALLEESIKKPLPIALTNFYAVANGLSIFCGSMSIRGYRPKFDRRNSARYPVSLSYGNVIELPHGSDGSDRIVFGFYADGDGYEVSILPGQGDIVVLTNRRRAAPYLRIWESFTAFLEDEVKRLSKDFATRGGVCDPLNVLPAPTGI